MIPFPRFLALAGAAALAGCATQETSSPAAPAQAAAAATVPHGTLPVLKVGSTTDEIIAQVGKPLEVAPMKTASGTAESWIYRRVLDQQTKQVAEASRGAAVVEPAHGIVSAGVEMPETEYHTEYVTTYQITELLIFNGKLAASKQHVETRESINN
jgi:hypothetical protein